MTKTLFFFIISTDSEVDPQGRDGGTPGAPAGAQRHDSGGGAGESAGLTKIAATMERFVAVVKQYPVQQQVDLAVEIEVPGSWFGAGPMGSLTATEQREKYKAQAVEYAEVHEFPGATKGARQASVLLQGQQVVLPRRGQRVFSHVF